MAEHLTPLDASFLNVEDADRHTNLGMGALAVLDGPMPDHHTLMSVLGERIAACPRFAQRLRRRLFDLGSPEWVEDRNFKLANHVCGIAVPGAGSDNDLFSVVAEVMSWRLERDRPLWEIWVIGGLSDDRWAMLVKVHPCIADAVATVHILAGLSDEGPAHGTMPGAVAAAAAGGWRGALRLASSIATATVAGVMRTDQALRDAAEFAAGLRRPATPLNGPLTSRRRRYVSARVSAAEVDRICQTFDVTVDDVALAALTESYRNMMVRRGEQPKSDSLRTLVPLRQAVLLPRLPVDEDNPVVRLRLVHARLAQARADADRGPASAVAAVARAIPVPVTAWATNLLSRLPQRSVVALAASVPGPGRPLAIMGRPVSAVLPVPPIAMQLRTGAAILRYADSLFFGIVSDYGTVRDADELARGVEAAVARLLVRSRRRRAGRDRHGLSLVVNV
ncbi:triacylglycerol synthase [Mycolicibacter sinensis]|uniref:Diacylglycerol O-acyltransferase n=1 Tax=Mycolicibacter sinensis (strain JDM601) TaxID=875328 RepID=F5YW87_MYCSD|nr:wax ester/triacylglycerol synthase family O-acyltransferase [Mycolicibacter sinensis]AEF36498.1 triacylglycerol synthase [Mycolicibacter sinensis]